MFIQTSQNMSAHQRDSGIDFSGRSFWLLPRIAATKGEQEGVPHHHHHPHPHSYYACISGVVMGGRA